MKRSFDNLRKRDSSNLSTMHKHTLSRESDVALFLLDSLWTSENVRNLDWVAPLENKLSKLSPVPKALKEAVKNARFDEIFVGAPKISEGVKEWASGGKEFQSQCKSSSPEILEYFKSLFLYIENSSSHRISPQDLFHGHMFFIRNVPFSNVPRDGEMGIIFHCKEYPRDLDSIKGANSPYDSSSIDYRDRNILYLMSQNKMYIIKPQVSRMELAKNTQNSLILLQGVDIWNELSEKQKQEIMSDFPGETVNPFTKAYSVREDAFYALGEQLPDVNYLPVDLARENLGLRDKRAEKAEPPEYDVAQAKIIESKDFQPVSPKPHSQSKSSNGIETEAKYSHKSDYVLFFK